MFASSVFQILILLQRVKLIISFQFLVFVVRTPVNINILPHFRGGTILEYIHSLSFSPAHSHFGSFRTELNMPSLETRDQLILLRLQIFIACGYF